MQGLNFQRQFRTSSSEGFLILENNQRIGRVDLHYASENVYATVVLEVPLPENEVAHIIEEIDERLVVTATVKRDDLNVWVYQGQEVGFFNDEFLEEEFEADSTEDSLLDYEEEEV
ncbi:MAG: hypothetical protein HXX08_03380 [Chloroflexi bacterium]|uniref:Uncharacterized protein n=1 Tax=Candidatus Chlorohelix allophototropha TaxID=3003348 RepID=A0A8T7LSB2_9CHLR|nr:hypothetical protein [Chloroflexota bacterium]WJW66779.1 hypothetical protein OZ401_000024 [Chloroflexota bacterium L227-S17]